MSREDVDRVREMHSLYESGDRVSWRDYFHADVEWDITDTDLPIAGLYRGHEGVERFFEEWLAVWADYGQETVEFIDAGSAIVVVFRQWGRGRTSGIRIEGEFYGVYFMREGKVARYVHADSRERALAVARGAS